MQMVGSFAELERTMIHERTTDGIAMERAKGRTGDQRSRLDETKQRDITESVIAGCKTNAEMARLHDASQPTASRIMAEHQVSTR